MVVNKINLMAIILVFANVFLTTVSTNDNPYALQECFLAMEYFCGLKNPSALACARVAIKFWKSKLPNDDIQQYYEALYEKLSINLNVFETPLSFCHRKKLTSREQCRNELKNYIPENHLRCNKSELLNYAVRHAFFNAVMGNVGSNTSASSSSKKYKYTYEDNYILSIHRIIEVKHDMDSPDVFCRIKYIPGYTKPSDQNEIVTLNFNAFNTEEFKDAVDQCLTAMESYCRVEVPTALDCAQAAIKSWSRENISHKDVQEYYESLFMKLNLNGIQTPAEFCHNKKVPKRKPCKLDLQGFIGRPRRNKNELRMVAIRRAYFDTVLSCDCEESDYCCHSYENKYMLSIIKRIDVNSDMDSPEEFCRRKYLPDYRK